MLSPAKNLHCGIEAVKHGADAVYIGAPRFGARVAAGNSWEDLEKLVRFAHLYSAKVHVTLNTILTDAELEDARNMAWRCYEIGADALIVQDMGLLRADLPPIALHASTQADNRMPEKVKFLQEVGFQRVILARELSLSQIKAIRQASEVELEAFVHGALCVSYSGQCYMSYAGCGRSANRGECAQYCRLPYTLKDAEGKVLQQERHLLSLKDMNRSGSLREMIEAGITSFKIEGRLKEADYVKNITLYYRRKLDALLEGKPEPDGESDVDSDRFARNCSGGISDRNSGVDLDMDSDVDSGKGSGNGTNIFSDGIWAKASAGKVTAFFEPHPEKSFNRGFTEYFLHGRRGDEHQWATPKSMGEPLGKVIGVTPKFFQLQTEKTLHNGDGLCFLDERRQLVGFRLNRVEANRLFPLEMPDGLQKGVMLYRNEDRLFSKQLEGETAVRKIAVSLLFGETEKGFSLTMTDEEGCRVTREIEIEKQLAQQPEQAEAQIRRQLSKMGETPFELENVTIQCAKSYFLPVSAINGLRREAAETLQSLRENRRPHEVRREEKPVTYPLASVLHSPVASESPVPPCPSKDSAHCQGVEAVHDETSSYPLPSFWDYTANVMNQAARQFYSEHGVEQIFPALEACCMGRTAQPLLLMRCKYCIRYAMGKCKRKPEGTALREPLYMESADRRYQLQFDCEHCEMKVLEVSFGTPL